MTHTHDEIRIEKVWGTDNRLYELIAPFVMNPEVIRLNGGYPFKNTEDHLWYISVKGKNMVTGFISIVNDHLCNDFTWQDKDLLRILIERALMDVEKGTPVTFVADNSDRPLLEEMGFSVEKQWTKYFKMVKII
ncbi:phospholipase D-like domain-containing protein [Dysgonomonas termitidis]|uniref:N-acetyltransferase domain-containing protein n=1 Tax=Dysgonomonas termitidis TaxID=1516126 RepID=A0ABV9KQY1_9BACT